MTCPMRILRFAATLLGVAAGRYLGRERQPDSSSIAFPVATGKLNGICYSSGPWRPEDMANSDGVGR